VKRFEPLETEPVTRSDPDLKSFQFFIFILIFEMTSEPIRASLHRSDAPISAKLISRKHVCPKSVLSHKDFRVLGPTHFVGCPEFGKTHFPKTRLPEIGTSVRAIRAFYPKMGTNVHFFF
jgi:hypothetical protein